MSIKRMQELAGVKPNKSSIEWLEERFYFTNGQLIDIDFEQAKEMHKQEMIKFAKDYTNNCIYCSGEFDLENSAENYYEETFK